MLLTTVLFITQISTVIISITHQAIIKALACVTVKQILTAIWGKKNNKQKPLVGHQSRIGCYSSSWYNRSISWGSKGRGGTHNGDLVHIYCFTGEETGAEEPLACSRPYNKLL